MGEPVLKASDVPTKLPANKDNAVVKSELVVDGVIWHVTCVSMGNPHCVTFSREGSQVFILTYSTYFILRFAFMMYYTVHTRSIQRMKYCGIVGRQDINPWDQYNDVVYIYK